jgi:hypothetical protein
MMRPMMWLVQPASPTDDQCTAVTYSAQMATARHRDDTSRRLSSRDRDLGARIYRVDLTQCGRDGVAW